jgi:OmpA-OmpF porin, OOP family
MLRLCVLFFSCITMLASAAEPKSNGVYIGAAAGSATLDDDGAFNGLNFDDEDSSASFLAGYKFNPYFSLEARYSYLGSYTLSSFFASEDLEITALSIHAVGTIPLGQSGFSLFGQLGAASLMADCSGCDDTGAASGGLGVAYNFTEGLALALQVDSYVWEEDGFYTDYDFSVSTAQIALRYTF